MKLPKFETAAFDILSSEPTRYRRLDGLLTEIVSRRINIRFYRLRLWLLEFCDIIESVLEEPSLKSYRLNPTRRLPGFKETSR